MPKLWSKTIKAHHEDVKNAILDAVAGLVAAHGPQAVAMSEIATKTGVGRATLYKYFPDLTAVLSAWHERHINRHLEHLAEVRDQAPDDSARLEAVLEAYAQICQHRQDSELSALLHRGAHVAKAQQHLSKLLEDLLAEGAKSGRVRGDLPPEVLAGYCLHALTAASGLKTRAAIKGLVSVTLAGLRPFREI